MQDWLDRIAVIGFHVAELDIREESEPLQQVVAELARAAGLARLSGHWTRRGSRPSCSPNRTRAAVGRLDPGTLSPEARKRST